MTVLMHRLGLSLGMLTPIMLWRACPSYSRPVASTGSLESIVDYADISKKKRKKKTQKTAKTSWFKGAAVLFPAGVSHT